ncbi:MAG: family 16 glycosylhydrolase [Rikenellaceae bacterium]
MKKLLYAALLMTFASCTEAEEKPVVPFSDPNNTGNWVLNTDVSDEFNGTELDEDRWFIVGKFVDGKPTYVHPDNPKKKVWTGRAPSQFSGENHRFEDGILKLEMRWEPDFPFLEEIRVPVFGDPLPYENLTAPCIIGRRSFKYGYIEIRSKSADAEVTSGFWSMGPGLEFDFFESFGDGRDEGKEHLDSELWWSIRDWTNLKGKPAYTERKDVGFRFADDFHIYGVEWSEDGINYYIDGELFSSVTPEQATAWAKENYDVAEDYDGYVAKNEIFLWLDMEIFSWNGMPESREELTQNGTPEQKAGGFIDFEVDYIRVWQLAE